MRSIQELLVYNVWCTTSKACIDRTHLCDLSDDCGDNSDESDLVCAGYLKYDYETIDASIDITQGKTTNMQVKDLEANVLAFDYVVITIFYFFSCWQV